MQILLTNDDGIYAPGIIALYDKLSQFADVTVVAPDTEKSSVGHSITLRGPIFSGKVFRNKKFMGYGVSGTPSDCVKLALSKYCKRKPDMVISGINQGTNDGCSVFYSGTVAGAREGALNGIPSIAFSLDTFTEPKFETAASLAVDIVKKIHKIKIAKNIFLNVNIPFIPKSKIKGIITLRQGMIPIHGTFNKRYDPNGREYYWMSGRHPVKRKNLKFDTYALAQGYVTITPLKVDNTDYDHLEILEGLLNKGF